MREGEKRLRRRCGSRKERKDCGRVDVGDVLTQRRMDAERYEPRNTLNTRNAKTTQGLRPTRLRRRDARLNGRQLSGGDREEGVVGA